MLISLLPLFALSENFSKPNYITYTQPNLYAFNLNAGRYKVTCYGAQGGYSFAGGGFGNIGGRGASVSAYINIIGPFKTFYALIGGQGQSGSTGLAPGGFNGGGSSGWCKKWKHHWHHKQHRNGPGGGGGATELRYLINDIAYRIIVAAGGSGASYGSPGAPGGGLTGYNSYGPSARTNQNGGNQNGQGSSGNTAKYYPSSGGGGGYRGGLEGVASNSDPVGAVSDSGSSYISGFEGCTPNPEIIMDSGVMTPGVRDGNGYLQIDQVYECPENCISCSGPNQCKICDAQYRLYDGLCYSTCPVGSIDRSTYCEKCDSSCLDCSEIATNCTSCLEGFYLYMGKCYAKCPVGTFEYDKECKENCPLGTYSKGPFCEECNISCKECADNPTKCTDCPDGKYLFNNECVDKCPERSVRDGNKCLSECGANQFLYLDMCFNQCPKGTFKKGIICEVCHSSCEECRGSPDMCIKCTEKMHLFNSKCWDQCPEDYYTYKNVCVAECPASTLINGNECVDHCPKGKYNLNRICTNCDSSCANCENSSTLCTKCHKNKYLFSNQCLNDCPNQTYKYQNECVKVCPSGSYLSDNICKDALEYYGITVEHKRESKVPKVQAIIAITLLSIAFVAGGAYLAFIIIKG